MDWTPTITDRQGPLFQRIVSVLVDDIASGRLHHGQSLPTHRALAKQLGVDLTTVTRAYNEARRLGVIEARVGRGTFVSSAEPPGKAPLAPGIDLSMNLPPQPANADLAENLIRALAEVKAEGGLSAYLNYHNPGGTFGERNIAAKWLQPVLPGVTADRLLIFPGTQAAILCLLLALTKPGDKVFAEALAYPGLKAAAGVIGVDLIGIEMDEQGIKPAALDRACQLHRASVIFLTPTMHNPSTATMTPERRAQIARIIRKRSLILVEDDPYVFLAPGTMPIAHLIPERTYLAASLSKCIAPGVRTSLLVVPDQAAAMRLAGLLRATVQMSVPLMTAIVAGWMSDGSANAIVKAVRVEAAERQKLAREILSDQDYSAHPGGYHIWMPLPPDWPSSAFATAVRARGLAVVTGEAFAVGEAPNAIRVALGAAQTRGHLVRALEILRDALRSPPQQTQIV